MNATLTLLSALVLSAPPEVECKFEQVAPALTVDKMARSKDQTRAVLLVHGYRYYPTDESVCRADFRDWQRPTALLVRELARDADVFSFGYGQNADISTIAASPGLRDAVARMRKLGYREVVLVGHSAGALIVRQFIEDNPDSGVTKVIQACPPNAGTTVAGLDSFKSQRAFLDSLTPDVRQRVLKDRASKKIPDGVEFVCILGNYSGDSDGLVPCLNQWTPELRQQGIPVVTTNVVHMQVPRAAKSAELIASVVKTEQPRWKMEQVQKAEKEIFSK